MAIIKVTPELLRSKATEVRGYRSEHDATIQKLTNLVNGLTEVWEGESQKAFVSQFESMRSTFTNFSEILESYAKKMDAAATAFEQAEAQAKQVSAQ